MNLRITVVTLILGVGILTACKSTTAINCAPRQWHSQPPVRVDAALSKALAYLEENKQDLSRGYDLRAGRMDGYWWFDFVLLPLSPDYEYHITVYDSGKVEGPLAPPKEPFCVLSADRTIVKRGETVIITLTLYNPTGKAVNGPPIGWDTGELVAIGGDIEATWTSALDGSSRTIPEATDLCPPKVEAIPAWSSRSYRCRWESPFSGDGTILLKYAFYFDSREVTSALTLKSR